VDKDKDKDLRGDNGGWADPGVSGFRYSVRFKYSRFRLLGIVGGGLVTVGGGLDIGYT
jgi:hypothetical protein